MYYGTGLLWLIFPVVLYLALLIYGSVNIQSNFFIPVYCFTNSVEKHIALSFDDGPSPEFTPLVLSTLSQYDALATFFVIGKNIPGNEKILKQIDSAGHSIGNHSYSHTFFIDFKGKQEFKDEIMLTTECVAKVIGKRMVLFRPPYGVTTPHVAKAITELNCFVIGWSIRSYDTTSGSAHTIAQRVQSQIKPGAIILFHDTSSKTIEALKQTLDFAKNNDYKVVSVEQLLKINAYE